MSKEDEFDMLSRLCALLRFMAERGENGATLMEICKEVYDKSRMWQKYKKGLTRKSRKPLLSLGGRHRDRTCDFFRVRGIPSHFSSLTVTNSISVDA
jgi:hypothetical protein